MPLSEAERDSVLLTIAVVTGLGGGETAMPTI